MPTPKTLLELAGANVSPSKISNSCLLMIDMQNEYLDGELILPAAPKAIEVASRLLFEARKAGSPIFHIVHQGAPGKFFDLSDPRGQIVDELSPEMHETIIEKKLPNAFAETKLDKLIGESGISQLIVCGFMTHMCVSSSVRVALDLGYRITVAASACASRELPDTSGGTLSAEQMHQSALAALADRFAIVEHELENLI